jgi:putative copper export protein
MQRFLAIFGHWLHNLAFAAWAGGILAIGALVAPSAFHPDPQFVRQIGPEMVRQFAGLVIGESVRKLNTLAFVCAGIMLAATWAEWRVRGEQARRFLFVRAVLTAAALALALYLGIRLFPTMIHLRAADRMADFDRLHHLYEAVTEVQFWLLVAGALITAYIALPRKAGVRGEGSGVSEGVLRTS